MAAVLGISVAEESEGRFGFAQEWIEKASRELQHRLSMGSVGEMALIGLMRLRGYNSHYVDTPAGVQHILEREGKGDLNKVVLFHGLASCGAHYANLVRYLNKHVRGVLLPDSPGHGFSAIPPEDQRQFEYQETVNRAVAEVLDEPAVIFGNSLGGFLAIRFALAHPEKVKALVLCSPGGAAMSDQELQSFLDVFRLKTHEDAVNLIKKVFGKLPRFHNFIAWRLRARFSSKVLQDRLDKLRSSELLTAEELQSLKVPVILLWGKEDGVMPEGCLDFFQTNLPPDTRVIEPEGYGHAPFIKYSRPIANYILDVLTELAMKR